MVEVLDRAHWVDLVGLPFTPLGRGPQTYDCFGLLLEIYRRRGIVIADFFYGAEDIKAHSALLIAGVRTWRPAPPQGGSSLLFRSLASNAPQHVGVCIDDDRFIHATEDLGQVCLSRISRQPPLLLLGSYEPI